MNFKIAFISLWISLFLIACYEDKGNYDYLDHNEILSVGQYNSLTKNTITLGDTIRIAPKFTWKYPDRDTTENAFEFVWITTWGGDTICRERNIEFIPTECGKWTYYLFVTEKATGIVSRGSYSVTVNTPYLCGFVVASNMNNEGTLHYFRRDYYQDEDKTKHYYWSEEIDLYRRLHPTDPLGKLVHVDNYTRADYYDELMVFQENSEAYVLDGLMFYKSFNVRELFSVYPEGFIPKQFVRGGYVDVMLSADGKVYWKINNANSTLTHDSPFLEEPVYFSGNGANVSYFIDKLVNKGDCMIGYDAKNKRIISMYASFNSGNSYLGTYQNLIYKGDTLGYVSPLNYGDAELLYLGAYDSGLKYTSIIKKDGKYLLQDFQMTSGSASKEITINSQEEFAGSPYISDNSVFLRALQTAFLYFAEGDHLYYYNLNSKEMGLYGKFDGNITHMKLDPENKLLGLTTDAGSFYIVDASDVEILASSNPLESGLKHHVTGLGDIVNITWKWAGWYNQTFHRYQS